MRNLLIILACSVSFASSAQKPLEKVEFSSFVKEVFRSESDGRRTYGAFWIPAIYWDLVIQIAPEVPQSAFEAIKAETEDYIIVSVLDAEMKVNSYEPGWQMKSEYELRKSVTIEYEGKKYLPIETKDLPEMLSSIKNIMEPMFAQMLGDFGSGMNFLFFKIQDKKGKSLIDPYKSGSFKIFFGSEFITYNLPLPSLGNDKRCNEDSAVFPSNYVYCPYHGTKLDEIQEAETPEEPENLPPPQNVFER